jgi:tape measure domain-containing protein
MATISNNDIKIRYVVETANLEAAAQAFDKLSAEEKQALADLKKFNQESETTNKSMGQLGSIAGKVGGVLGGLFAVSQIKQFTSAVIETTVKFESMRKAIDFASGSMEAGSKNFEFLRDLANKLGLDLRATAEGYKTFTSAANLAGQSSQETNRQFAAVAKAAQVMGLSAEDTKGAFLALGQMMSKGNVQAEELRGQLGERLVGAFGIAAKAMGVTTGELNKMLQKGQVLAADFLPKFATELEKTFGKGNDQVTTLAASQNRFNSSIDQLILAIGNKLNPFLKGAYDLAAGIAQSLQKAAGGTEVKKATEDQVAARRIETELTKEALKLDQQRVITITAQNIEGVRRQIARNQLMGMEARIDAQMVKVTEARIAAAGTLNSRLQMNLSKQEKELLVLQQMEEQYAKIAGVIVNTPPPPPVVDEKERVKALNEEYQNRLKILELLKQQRILIGELFGDPLAKLGAEQAYQEAKLNLEKQYAQKGVDITKEQIEVTSLARQVAEQEFNQEAERLRMENYKAAVKSEEDLLKEREKLIKGFLDRTSKLEKDRQSSYDEAIKRETKKFEEAENRKIAAINLTSTIVLGAFDLYSSGINNQISLLNKRYDEEIRLADGNEQKIAEINQKRQQEERELKIKAFKTEQAAAVARVVFETAALIAKWSSNPVTLPLAALTIANQVAQIGFVLAQPVPEFAEGTKGKPFEGGMAMVGERGVEKVVTQSGKVYFTPPTATLVDLPKGSQVIPNHALSRQELFWANRLSGGNGSTSNPMYGKLDEIGSILKSLPITQLNMDERGFEKYIRTEKRTTKILNNRFRSV